MCRYTKSSSLRNAIRTLVSGETHPLSVCTFLTPININKYHTCTRKEASLSSLYAWQLWWLTIHMALKRSSALLGLESQLQWWWNSDTQANPYPVQPHLRLQLSLGLEILSSVWFIQVELHVWGNFNFFTGPKFCSPPNSFLFLHSLIHFLQNVGNHMVVS